MKIYIKYIALLGIGLLLGWLLFGKHTKVEKSSKLMDTPKKFWTCSMHPQIKQPQAGDCPICGMDLILGDAVEGQLSKEQFKLTKTAMALADIQTTIIQGDSNTTGVLSVSGKIQENQKNSSIQSSYFKGRIEKLYINFEGATIKKGQLLATIYAPALIKAQQELLTALDLKDTEPLLYKAVRNKLKLWKLSDVQISQIENTKNIKEFFPIYATTSGTVVEKLVNPGDYVQEGQTLLKVVNLNSVWATFDIYESEMVHFKEGQEIQISSSALPAGAVFKTKISFIEPSVNTSTRIIGIRATLPNEKGIFKPGMFIEGKIQSNPTATSAEVSTIAIPSSAVLWTGKRSVVYVKTNPEKPIFEMREVVLGSKTNDHYTIKNGLSIGEEIVTHGVFTVDASAQLQGKKSMMNHKKELPLQRTTTPEFKEKLQQVYDTYIQIKDALIQSDSVTSKATAFVMLQQLKNTSKNALTNRESIKEWKVISDHIRKISTAISSEEKLQQQRVYFKDLSTQLIDAVLTFGINEVAFQQYCPMADSDKGAYWLSKSKKVLNPYFGKSMLKCGEVKQVIHNQNP